MKRREFFQAIGVGAIALKFSGLLKLDVMEESELARELRSVRLPEPFFGKREFTCFCGEKIMIPYLPGPEAVEVEIDIPMRCGHRLKTTMIIPQGKGLTAYWTGE